MKAWVTQQYYDALAKKYRGLNFAYWFLAGLTLLACFVFIYQAGEDADLIDYLEHERWQLENRVDALNQDLSDSATLLDVCRRSLDYARNASVVEYKGDLRLSGFYGQGYAGSGCISRGGQLEEWNVSPIYRCSLPNANLPIWRALVKLPEGSDFGVWRVVNTETPAGVLVR